MAANAGCESSDAWQLPPTPLAVRPSKSATTAHPRLPRSDEATVGSIFTGFRGDHGLRAPLAPVLLGHPSESAANDGLT